MRYEIRKDLTELEIELLNEIDQDAERIRARFVTTTPMQAAVYQEKEWEARTFMDDPDVDDAIIPNVAKEAVRTGRTKLEVASTILSMAQFWRQVSAEIEDLRLAAKDRVRNATTVAGKRTAAIIDWTPILNLETDNG